MDFETDAKLKLPSLRPVADLAKKVLPVICPNPNVTISLPGKVTFGCR